MIMKKYVMAAALPRCSAPAYAAHPLVTADRTGARMHPAFVVGGLIYSVTENFDFDLGIKSGLNDAEPNTALLLGVARRFN